MKANWDASRPVRFAERKIVSEVPLPSLQPAAPPIHAVTLRINKPVVVARLRAGVAWLHSWPDPDGNTSLQFARLPGGLAGSSPTCLLRTPGLCDFRVHLDPACTLIDIEHLTNVDAATLEHLLIDQVLPRVIAEQGALVVHASCVRIGDGCALFLGGSGWGKSTLAALLQRHGHAPLSDDCAVLDIHDQQVLATATYPSLRLFDDSLRAGFDRVPDATPVASYTGKRRIRLDAPPPDQATPVSAIYLLNDPARPTYAPAIVPSPAAVACMALIEHGFRLDIASAERSAQQLRHAAAITRLVPAYALHYPRDFASADAVVERVLKHFGGLDVETKAIDRGL